MNQSPKAPSDATAHKGEDDDDLLHDHRLLDDFDDPFAENDADNERTFYQGEKLRKIRQFINENGTLAAMFAVVFVNLVGFGLVVPLISFFAQSLQAQPWQVALMFTAYSLGQFFAEPYFGKLSDRIGRKPVLLVTTALNTLFYLALAFAPTIWVAIFVRFLSGISSGNISTIQGYVSDVSRLDQRAGRLSLIGAAFSLGFVFGPVIGGGLTHNQVGQDVFRIPLFFAAGMAGLGALGVLLFVRESRKRYMKSSAPVNLVETAKQALRHPVILPVILSSLCYMMAFAGLEATFSLWAEHRYGWGPKEVGSIFLFIGLAGAAMQMFLMRPLVRRWGEFKILAAGLFFFGISFALQGINHEPNMIIPIVMLGTLGQAVIFASISAIISLSTSIQNQGAMLGLNMSTGSVARILGPVLAGFLYTASGADAPLWLGAGLCLPAAALALWAEKRKRI